MQVGSPSSRGGGSDFTDTQTLMGPSQRVPFVRCSEAHRQQTWGAAQKQLLGAANCPCGCAPARHSHKQCAAQTWGPCLRCGSGWAWSAPLGQRRGTSWFCDCCFVLSRVGSWLSLVDAVSSLQEGLRSLSRSTSFVCRLTLKGGSLVRLRLTPVVPATLASTLCVSL